MGGERGSSNLPQFLRIFQSTYKQDVFTMIYLVIRYGLILAVFQF